MNPQKQRTGLQIQYLFYVRSHDVHLLDSNSDYQSWTWTSRILERNFQSSQIIVLFSPSCSCFIHQNGFYHTRFHVCIIYIFTHICSKYTRIHIKYDTADIYYILSSLLNTLPLKLFLPVHYTPFCHPSHRQQTSTKLRCLRPTRRTGRSCRWGSGQFAIEAE